MTDEHPTAPRFTSSSTRYDIDLGRYLGKVPVVIVFTGHLQDPASARLVQDLNGAFASFGDLRVQLLIVVPEALTDLDHDAYARSITVPLLDDTAAELRSLYGVADDGSLVAVVIDLEGTVVDQLALTGERPSTAILERLDELRTAAPGRMVVAAPTSD